MKDRHNNNEFSTEEKKLAYQASPHDDKKLISDSKAQKSDAQDKEKMLQLLTAIYISNYCQNLPIDKIIEGYKVNLTDALFKKNYPAAIELATLAIDLLTKHKNEFPPDQLNKELSFFHLKLSLSYILHDPYHNSNIKKAIGCLKVVNKHDILDSFLTELLRDNVSIIVSEEEQLKSYQRQIAIGVIVKEQIIHQQKAKKQHFLTLYAYLIKAYLACSKGNEANDMLLKALKYFKEKHEKVEFLKTVFSQLVPDDLDKEITDVVLLKGAPLLLTLLPAHGYPKSLASKNYRLLGIRQFLFSDALNISIEDIVRFFKKAVELSESNLLDSLYKTIIHECINSERVNHSTAEELKTIFGLINPDLLNAKKYPYAALIQKTIAHQYSDEALDIENNPKEILSPFELDAPGSKIQKKEKEQEIQKQKGESKSDYALWQAKKEKSIQIRIERENEIRTFKNTLSFMKAINLAKLTSDAKKNPKDTIATIKSRLHELENGEKQYDTLAETMTKSISEIIALSLDVTELKARETIIRNQDILETQLKDLQKDIQKIHNHQQSLNKIKEDAEESVKNLFLKPHQSLFSKAMVNFNTIKAKLKDLKKLNELPIEEKINLLQQTKANMMSLSTQYKDEIKTQLETIRKEDCPELDELDASIRLSVKIRIKTKRNEISDLRAQIELWTSAKVSQITDQVADLEKEKKSAEDELARIEKAKEQQRAFVKKEQDKKSDKPKQQIRQAHPQKEQKNKRIDIYQAKMEATRKKKDDEDKKKEDERKKEEARIKEESHIKEESNRKEEDERKQEEARRKEEDERKQEEARKKEDDERKQEEARKKEEVLEIAAKKCALFLTHLNNLQTQSMTLIQLIQKCAQDPEQSDTILLSIEREFSTLEHWIEKYQADLRAMVPACQDHAQKIAYCKNQLNTLLSQQDNIKKNIIFIQTQLFDKNCQKIKSTVNQIIAASREGAEQLKALDAKHFATISNKSFEIENSLAVLTINYNRAKQKLQEAIKQYELIKHCQSYLKFNAIDVAHLEPLTRKLNSARNRLEKASNTLEQYNYELSLKTYHYLTSFVHLLADKKKAAALDYIHRLQKILRRRIYLKGGISISAGVNCYHRSKDRADRVELCDIDGTIYTSNPDNLVNSLTLDEQSGGEGFQVTYTCKGKYKDAEGRPLRNSFGKSIEGTLYTNVHKIIDGVSVELTIAHRHQYSTEFISPLVTLGQLCVLDAKNYSDEYDMVEKINDDFIIAIKRDDLFEQAVQGREWYIPYQPKIHKNYCYAVLKSHRKSKQIQDADEKYSTPPKSCLSYEGVIKDLQKKFDELVAEHQGQPDYEIDKVLKEIKAISDEVKCFVAIYCGSLLKHKNHKADNAFTDLALNSMIHELVMYLEDNYKVIFLDDKNKSSKEIEMTDERKGINKKDEDKPSTRIKTKVDEIFAFKLKHPNERFVEAEKSPASDKSCADAKKSADPDKSCVEETQLSEPPKPSGMISIFRDPSKKTSIRQPSKPPSQPQPQSFGSR